MSSIKLSREQLKNLTATERKEYDKKMNAERIRRYREANKDKQEYKDYNKNYTKTYRAEHKEEYRKKNIEHNKTYRAKKKAIKNANISDRRGKKLDVKELLEVRKELASKTIADNYKVHLAKKKVNEMKSLKDKIIEYKAKARRGRPTNIEKIMKENAGKPRPKKS